MTNTAEVVALLRKVVRDDGLTDAEKRSAITSRFPDLTVGQYKRALRVWEDELKAEREESICRYEQDMQDCDEAEHIFAGLTGVNFGQAIAIKAAQGDPIALKWQRAMTTKEYRIRSALSDVAFEIHPDWSREGDIFTWTGTGSAPSEDQMIDWLQRNHPAKARAIEDALEA